MPIDPFADDSEDDLFSSAPKVKKSASEKPKYKNREIVEEKKKVEEKKPTQNIVDKKPLPKHTKSSIFDDDDDDLFASPSTTSKPKLVKEPLFGTSPDSDSQKEPTSYEKPEYYDQTDSSSVKSIPGELVSPVSEFSDNDQADGVPEKPRKPVGGVSMFGGIDPLAARNNLKNASKTSCR